MKNKNNFLRRGVAWLVLLCMSLCLLAGCEGPSADGGKIQIVCTTFPLYDWTKNIVGDSDSVSVELLVKSGTDLHSFQPSVADIAKISSADLLIHIGGSSDTWVQDAAKQAKGTELLTLSEIGGITLRSTDMEEEEMHGSAADHHHHDFDEHIWLSLKNAMVCSQAIANAVSALDAENATLYAGNLEKYRAELSSLDKEFEELTQNAEQKPVIFADRFPFIYTFSDYDIGYLSAFSGCDTDAEASFETVIKLAEAVDKDQIKYILVTESSDKKIANQVISASNSGNASVLILDSMQSVTYAQIENGASYTAIMRSNLEVLETVLAD